MNWNDSKATRCRADRARLLAESVGPARYLRCSDCQSLWFRRQDFIDLVDAPTEVWKIQEAEDDAVEGGFEVTFTCICGVEMKPQFFDAVRLDICPNCDGIRIMGGDLRRVVARHGGDGDYLLEMIEHGPRFPPSGFVSGP